MTAKTDAERQKLRYDRKKAGLVLVREWVPAGKVDAVRRAIDAVVNNHFFANVPGGGGGGGGNSSAKGG